MLEGRIVAGFEIREPIGRGAMGVVHRAIQVSLDRPVAFKVLSMPDGPDGDGVKRFRRERRIHLNLSHPHVVTVYDAGDVDGYPFLAMELVEGLSLSARLARDGPLSREKVVQLAMGMMDALVYLHMEGVLHRDLKPANLLIDPSDVIKVTDFGLARVGDQGTFLTGAQHLVGTLPYLAPELLDGREASPASDIYGAGLIIHEMLTGRPVFDAPSATMVMDRIRAGDIRSPVTLGRKDTPPRLERLLMRMVALIPESRPTAEQCLAELARCAIELGVSLAGVRAPGSENHVDLMSVTPLPGVHRRERWSHWPRLGNRHWAAIGLGLTLLVPALYHLGGITPKGKGSSPAESVPTTTEAVRPEARIRWMREEALGALRLVERYDRGTPALTDSRLATIDMMRYGARGIGLYRSRTGDLSLLASALNRIVDVIERGDEDHVDDLVWLDVDRMGFEILSEVTISHGFDRTSSLRPQLERLQRLVAGGDDTLWRRALADSFLFYMARFDNIDDTGRRRQIASIGGLLRQLKAQPASWRDSPRGWLTRLNLHHRLELAWKTESVIGDPSVHEEAARRHNEVVQNTFQEIRSRSRTDLVADPDVVSWTRWLTFHAIADAAPLLMHTPEFRLVALNVLDELAPHLDFEALPPLGAVAACASVDLLATEKFALELTLLQPRLAAWGQSCKSIRNRQGFVQGPIFRNRYGALPKVNE